MAQPQEQSTKSEEQVPRREQSWWERFLSSVLPTVTVLLLVGLLGVVIASYRIGTGWEWTGITPSTETTTTTKGTEVTTTVKEVGPKTLWDWLQLLFVPVVIGVATYVFRRTEQNIERQRTEEHARRERAAANRRAETEQALALDAQRESALQTYLDQMTHLLLDEQLRASREGAEVRSVARARTLTALQTLDRARKGTVLKFLYEAGLISGVEGLGADSEEKIRVGSVVRLSSANLQGADLVEANLGSADLRGADLTEANLEGADLRGAKLGSADLQGAKLGEANLRRADLRRANLQGANLSESERHHHYKSPDTIRVPDPEDLDLRGADLTEAKLEGADLTEAHLTGANLRGADLTEAKLEGAHLGGAGLIEANLTGANLQGAWLLAANLRGANLTGANLQGASLIRAGLTGADLTEAKLASADLGGADLRGATVTPEQLDIAKSTQYAKLPFDPETRRVQGGGGQPSEIQDEPPADLPTAANQHHPPPTTPTEQQEQ